MAAIALGVHRRGHLRAIGLASLGFGLFSAGDAVMKIMAGGYPLPQAVFFNALFSLIPIIGMALWSGGLRQLGTRRPGLHLLRATLGLVTGYAGYFAFARMPMADVYAVLFTAPLVITLLSALLFGERVDGRRWLAVLAGFAGVLVMNRPSAAGIVNVGAVGAAVCALCYAASALIIRHKGQTEHALTFPFYANLLALPVLGGFLPSVYVTPSFEDFALTAVGGVLSGVALTCLLTAFRNAPSPVIAPFQYSQILWGVLFGALLFGDWPEPKLAVGLALVIGSGLYLLRREARDATG